MQGVTLLGPRSMEDIRQAALATLAPPPDRIAEFDALFRSFFYGEATVAVDEGDEDTEVKDDSGVEQRRRAAGTPAGGERRSPLRRRSASATARSRPSARSLAAFRSALPAALPQRRSFRSVSHAIRAASSISAARCARSCAPTATCRAAAAPPADGFAQAADSDRHFRLDEAAHRPTISSSRMPSCRRADRAEVFTFGTRLTRITPCAQRPRPRRCAGSASAALVDDWDGGTRIGPTLLAFLACRASPLSRAARRS